MISDQTLISLNLNYVPQRGRLKALLSTFKIESNQIDLNLNLILLLGKLLLFDISLADEILTDELTTTYTRR
jgi:hypothetical protein